jgi:hypothetical protein
MLSRIILPAIARLLVTFLPASTWYRCAWLASGVLASLLRWRFGGGELKPHRFEQAILLNRLLAFLTRAGQPFPVPWRMEPETRGLMNAATLSGRGVVFCSAHLPLVKVGVRALMESGRTPTAAIAAEPGVDGRIPIWGLAERLPAFKVKPDVLLRTRTVLRGGGSVLLLVDTIRGDYSPNIFRLAGVTGATVLFFTTELEGDGCVLVSVFPAPFSACANRAEITGNVLALDREIKRISGRQGEGRFDTVQAVRLT